MKSIGEALNKYLNTNAPAIPKIDGGHYKPDHPQFCVLCAVKHYVADNRNVFLVCF